MRRENVYLRIGWICLAAVGVGILGFGLVAAVAPAGGDQPLMELTAWPRLAWACSA